jgi:hypothetical protein
MRFSIPSVFLIPFAIISIFISAEVAFRLTYFGPGGLNPLNYNPRPNTVANIVEAVDDSLLPYRLKSDFHGYFKGAPFNTNSEGWRSPAISLVKPSQTTRIAILGASVTMGAGVADDEVYSAQLQTLLNHQGLETYEVLNFGVGGYTLEQMFAVYERYTKAFVPDILIIPILSLDERVNGQYAPLHAYLPKWDNLRGYFLDSFFYKGLRRSGHKYLQTFLALDWKERGRPTPEDRRLTNKVVLSNFLHQHSDLPIYLLVLHRINELQLTQHQTKHDRLTNLAALYPNVKVIDTVLSLQGKINKTDTIYWGDNHPNAKVHALYAHVIAQQISTQ